jgi:misacylated tRNA(Ala) deacylase
MSLLTCQQDAYRRTLTAPVLGITPQPDGGVEVLLSDTVLYPEGGGQPDDHGTIDGMPVLGLRRTDGGVAHRLAAAPAGDTVTVAVDWARRLDHMQQHTAQHLLSALAADRLHADTTAFHLGAEVCDIQLSRMLTPAETRSLQDWANAEIRANRAVGMSLVTAEDLDGVRSRGLPEGLTGPVRLVTIAGIDRNTCGGTHVASTAELQAVVVLPPLSQKGGCQLRYLAGGRVIDGLAAAHDRETALSRDLSCGPEQHAMAIGRLQVSLADALKDRKALQIELAGLLGEALARSGERWLHRPGEDLPFLGGIVSAAVRQCPDRVFLATTGLDHAAGMFVLAGPPEPVAALGPRVAAALDGRGGGRAGRYQGKAQRMDLAALAALLENSGL